MSVISHLPETTLTMSLAIFDLDNTLLRGDSDHAWGQFLVEQGVVDAAEYAKANDAFFQAYQAGNLDIHDYLEFALRPLAETPLSTLEALREQFMEHWVEPRVLPAGEALIRWHEDQGHLPLIITATNRFVTEPIARRLNIDQLIATDPEFRNGRYTGKVDGVPSFREGKVTRLDDWLKQQQRQLDNAWFYSDSYNDVPLLERVSQPVAVDPDDTLADIARQRGWKIISLRE